MAVAWVQDGAQSRRRAARSSGFPFASLDTRAVLSATQIVAAQASRTGIHVSSSPLLLQATARSLEQIAASPSRTMCVVLSSTHARNRVKCELLTLTYSEQGARMDVVLGGGRHADTAPADVAAQLSTATDELAAPRTLARATSPRQGRWRQVAERCPAVAGLRFEVARNRRPRGEAVCVRGLTSLCMYVFVADCLRAQNRPRAAATAHN